VSVSHVKDLFDHEALLELKVAPKLREELLDGSGHFNKMRVSNSTSVINNRTVSGSVLRTLSERYSHARVPQFPFCVENSHTVMKVLFSNICDKSILFYIYSQYTLRHVFEVSKTELNKRISLKLVTLLRLASRRRVVFV